jgi:hypothetical protein
MMDHGKNLMFGVSTDIDGICCCCRQEKKTIRHATMDVDIHHVCQMFDGLAQINMDTISLVGGSMCQVDAFPLK